MNIRVLGIAMLLVFIGCAGMSQPTGHGIRYTITALDEGGGPLSSVPFVGSLGGRTGPRPLWTGADGKVIDFALAPDGPAELIVVPIAAELASDPMAVGDRAQAFRDLMCKRCLKKWYSVPLTGVESSVTKTITLVKGVALTGSISVPSDTSGLIVSRNRGLSIWFGTAGPFKIGGFNRGEPAVYFIAREGSNVVLPQSVAIPADASFETAITVPEVTWPSDDDSTHGIDVTIQNWHDLPVIYGSLKLSVSLVSSSGLRLYTFPYDRSTGKVIADLLHPSGVPHVAPGTYYVMLGDLVVGPADLGYEAVRTGRLAELDADGFPKLVVPVDGAAPGALVVDAGVLWPKMKALYP